MVGNIYQTVNGIEFDGVEIIGKITSVNSGNDYSSFTISSMEQDGVSAIVKESGKFRNEDTCIFMSRLTEEMIVLVRGRYAMYEYDGDLKQYVRPKQIIVIDYPFVDLWYLKLLKSRIRNRYPVIKDDDLALIAYREKINHVDVEGRQDLVQFNYTIGSASHVVPSRERQRGASAVAASMPSRKPSIPREIHRKVDEIRSTRESIADRIVESTGMTKGELDERIEDMRLKFDMLGDGDILFNIAKEFNVNIDDIFNKKSPVKARSTTNVTTKSMQDSGDRLESTIIGYIKGAGGKMDLVLLRETVRKSGFNSRQVEAAIINLYDDGLVEMDSDEIRITAG